MPDAVPRPAASGWVQGPTPDTVAEHLRSLELMITRRLDGVLHGSYQGLTPGHGSEPGESRQYQPGDDVRRIDWNVTARTNETYVREQIADRDLSAWLVVDVSATMDFGTQANDKAQTAMAAAATVGFLTARSQNRLGAVLVAGPNIHVMPPRAGQNQVRRDPRVARVRSRRPKVPAPPIWPAPSTGSGRSHIAADSWPSSRTSPANAGSNRSVGRECGTRCSRSSCPTLASTTCRRSDSSNWSTRRPDGPERSG